MPIPIDPSPINPHVHERGWRKSPIPQILENIPDNLTLNRKLQQILSWSLQRTEDQVLQTESGLTFADNIGEAVPTKPHTDQLETNYTSDLPVTDSSDASSTTFSPKSNTAGGFRSRLKQIRQDIATKIASKDQGKARATDDYASTGSNEVAGNRECISCFDEFMKDNLVRLGCSHDYCRSCLRAMVLTAMTNEFAFPSKCCLTEIPLKTILTCLDDKQREQYKNKSAEYSIPAGHRWYCPQPTCSKWIRPETLHRDRRSHQTCPHCKAKICSMCRSLAHDGSQDCPQDFGLQSTLEVAEAEGYQRCQGCHTLVELTTGCRHITCRCGAEFCYVCNARWRTCSCTEADKDRRLQELRTRRQDRERHEREAEQRQQEDAAAAQAEAEEIAEAIRQIEEFERQESIRLAEEERRRQIEEELILARLEEERLLAEIARREAEEEAERQLLEILLHSSKEELDSMADKLQQIINFQRAALSSTHMRRKQAITNEQQARMLEITKENNRLSAWLDQNVRRRQEALHNRHNQEREQMIQQAEQEEDDLFMEMTMYLRDKPNRAQRESKMRETFQKQQQDKQEQLINKHKQERDKLAMETEYEYEGLRKSVQTKMEPIEIRLKATLKTLGNQIGCDRRWFEVISERRVQMLTKHELIVIEQVGMGQEPIGLTEDVASGLQPLPRIDDTDDEDDGQPESSGSRYGFVDGNTAPAQLPPQVVETEDLYGASQDFFELSGSSSFRPTTTSATTNAGPPLSRDSRSGTVSDRIPGAFPPSEAGPSKTPTLPRTASKHHSSTIPKSAAMSMYGMMAMSFVVPEPRDSLQRSLSNVQSQGVASLADSSQRLSATTTATSISVSRPSAITTDTTSFDTVPTAQVSGSSKEDTLRAKKSFFGRLGRRKELSEDEIRQRMVRCVGDGMGS